MPRDESKSGVWIYESFEYPENKDVYMAVIFADVDPLQYWRDRPLLINRAQPELYQAINLTPTGLAEITEVESAIDTISEVKVLDEVLDDQEEATEEVNQQMKDAEFERPTAKMYKKEWQAEEGQTVFKSDGVLGSDTPTVTVAGRTLDRDEFSIEGDQIRLHEPAPEGQAVRFSSSTILEEIVLPYSKNITLVLDLDPINSIEDYQGISILDNSVLDRITINTIPDDEIDDEFSEFFKDFSNTFIPVQEQNIEIYNQIPEDQISWNQEERTKLANDAWEPMGELTDEWYGIPLINIGPRDIPTKDSFIVNINSKNDWNVSVTNLVSTGLEKDMLTINKQIPPGKKFVLCVYQIYNNFGLLLRIEGDPKMYEKTLQVSGGIKGEVISYGVDNDAVKTLSGNMWDVMFMPVPDNFNHNVPTPEPDYPDDGWIYDFTDIDSDNIESVYDYGPTARAPNAKFIPLEPNEENIVTGYPGVHRCSFIYESYVDNFLCREKLQSQDFTILWYQWIYQYPTGIANWISDSTHSNYLSYDYDTFEILLEFNGREFRERITLPEELWSQLSFRYNQELGKATIAILDARYSILDEATFNIGTDLDFSLTSMFGRYSKEDGDFIQKQQALTGMIMIHQEAKTNQQLRETDSELIRYLSQYRPTQQQLIEQTQSTVKTDRVEYSGTNNTYPAFYGES